MTKENFCYWLQGYFEISGEAVLTEAQAEIVKAKLNTVFSNNSSGSIQAHIFPKDIPTLAPPAINNILYNSAFPNSLNPLANVVITC
jgi:hypothetical protein